jgi:hypothetical protein
MNELTERFILDIIQQGGDLTTPKMKSEVLWKVACQLKKTKIGKWADVELYHMNTHAYKASKCL